MSSSPMNRIRCPSRANRTSAAAFASGRLTAAMVGRGPQTATRYSTALSRSRLLDRGRLRWAQVDCVGLLFPLITAKAPCSEDGIPGTPANPLQGCRRIHRLTTRGLLHLSEHCPAATRNSSCFYYYNDSLSDRVIFATNLDPKRTAMSVLPWLARSRIRRSRHHI